MAVRMPGVGPPKQTWWPTVVWHIVCAHMCFWNEPLIKTDRSGADWRTDEVSALRNSVAWLVASLRGVLVKITEHTEKAALKELSCRQPRELCAG